MYTHINILSNHNMIRTITSILSARMSTPISKVPIRYLRGTEYSSYSMPPNKNHKLDIPESTDYSKVEFTHSSKVESTYSSKVESRNDINNSKIDLVISNSSDPYFNIALESKLLTLSGNSVKLMVYRNAPCVSIGSMQSISDVCRLENIEKDSIPIVRRIDGGGAMFNDNNLLFASFIRPSGFDISRSHINNPVFWNKGILTSMYRPKSFHFKDSIMDRWNIACDYSFRSNDRYLKKYLIPELQKIDHKDFFKSLFDLNFNQKDINCRFPSSKESCDANKLAKMLKTREFIYGPVRDMSCEFVYLEHDFSFGHVRLEFDISSLEPGSSIRTIKNARLYSDCEDVYCMKEIEQMFIGSPYDDHVFISKFNFLINNYYYRHEASNIFLIEFAIWFMNAIRSNPEYKLNMRVNSERQLSMWYNVEHFINKI